MGMPTRVLVAPVAGGWAQSIAGVACGRPDPADAAQAKAVVAETVTAIARDRHGRTGEIEWEPLPDGAWAGRVREGGAR
ncbi:hypothetical protein WKI68_40860 [Streptomyces sp. MS1.HAVA.3]|uniref:Uncharacterized protein n=1 Tax=Streptomyces caledonius TaxID=3134107 RepID=A0ABU8UEC7_9ACTN